MITTTTQYETGATSYAVNDLILFADNTYRLSTAYFTLKNYYYLSL